MYICFIKVTMRKWSIETGLTGKEKIELNIYKHLGYDDQILYKLKC